MAAILVIEDDLHFGATLLELLQHNGHEADQATSAAEAIQKARQRSYHLVLTDVRIAGEIDGVGALEAIQALRPQIRSIIMTGYADQDVPVRAARLQADDYIYKPFKLKVLLQAVRAVLERETPFRGLYQRVAEAPIQATQKALRWVFDSQLQKLNEQRQGCLKQFFLLLRSKHLAPEAAYRVFCAWENLELEYLSANNPQQWSRLGQAYFEFEEQMTRSRSLSPPSKVLSLALFEQLQAKILSGRVEWVHLLKAIQLLHFPEARRENVESYSTYHWLWSDQNEQDDDPFLGLTMGAYTLKSLRSSSGQTRLYEASNEVKRQQGDLILCLAAVPETESMVQQEQNSQRASLLSSQLGHHFLLYRGHALSLKMNLPADGLSPAEAWKALRPVFYQVEAYHQQGQFSGCFSLHDIDCVPDQPCRLSNFSDSAYRHQHQHFKDAGMLNLTLYSAPEVHQQALPTAASDQAVLGRILFEVLWGGNYPHAETRLRLRDLGSEQSNEHFRAFIPRLEPLARAFYLLCHADPEQRFASLRQAIEVIEKALAK